MSLGGRTAGRARISILIGRRPGIASLWRKDVHVVGEEPETFSEVNSFLPSKYGI